MSNLKTPKVSVLCITYNQAIYVKQTLDGFLMQKTDFPFEILINDDGSTDDTVKIIKEYQKQYPDIVKPIFHKENQYSQGKRNFMLRYLIPKAKGEYLALCEGDDYWDDAAKLQQQVDFLDKNKDYALCFHPVRVFFENGEKPDSIYPEITTKSDFTVINLLKRNFIQTNSVMYRRQQYEGVRTDVMPGDWYLHLFHAQFGKIGFINKVMSSYRRHPGGIWWQTTREGDMDEFWKKYGTSHINLYVELLKMYGDTPLHRDVIDNNIANAVSALNRVDNKYNTKLIQSYADSQADQIRTLLMSLSRTVYISQWSIEKLNHSIMTSEKNYTAQIEHLEQEKLHLEQEKLHLEQEKLKIIRSKAFRLGRSLVRPYRKIYSLLKRS